MPHQSANTISHCPAASKRTDNPPLRFRIVVNVPLCCVQRLVTRHHLHITKRAADSRNLLRRFRDECAPPRVSRAANQSKITIPASKHVHDHLRRSAICPLRANNKSVRDVICISQRRYSCCWSLESCERLSPARPFRADRPHTPESFRGDAG